MKNIYILLLVSVFSVSTAIAKQKAYKGKMNVTPLKLEKVGDSLHINIDFDITGVSVGARRSISLIPILVAPDREQKLPEIMVKGRANYLTSKREVALMSKTERDFYNENPPYAIIKGYKSDSQKQISYRKNIAFEPWMKNVRLDIDEDLCGCGNPPRKLSTSQLLDNVQMGLLFAPQLAYVSPKVETVKHREISGEASLDFVVNKVDIRPEYMNNPHELKKIADMISNIEADESISVDAISVIGYASPEGDVRVNKQLSIGRANALVSYLQPFFDYDKSLYKIEYGAENWAGLKSAVEKSDMKYKAEILAIIDSVPVIDAKKDIGRNKSLMNLDGGKPYKYLHQQIYPRLRTAICKINYQVKGFDVAQAKEVIQTNPQNLSLNEMYLVANTYEVGSQEFINILETAATIFPDDQTANLNAATAALARNDIALAEKYLSKVTVASAEYNNTKGALLILKGEHAEAEVHLKKAADAGLEVARINLEELKKR